MLIHPTVSRLRDIGLSAMADALVAMTNDPEAASLPHADWLGLLVDREATAREDRRLQRRLHGAKLRQAAVVENVDLRSSRGLDRALFKALATSDWVREHQHLAVTGPTGTGKSWLACALGHKACRDGFSVLYKRAPRLFADLAQARGEGRLARLMTTLERTDLLIPRATACAGKRRRGLHDAPRQRSPPLPTGPSHARRRDASWWSCAAVRGALPWTAGTITRPPRPALTRPTPSPTTQPSATPLPIMKPRPKSRVAYYRDHRIR